MANLPFLISFTLSSANASGSSARPRGSKLPPGNTVTLNRTHQDNLSSPNGQDALGVDQVRVAQVVKSTLAKDLSSSLEPHSLTELDTVASQQLWKDTSEGSKHGPSAVDHLKLTVLGKGFRVCGKPSGVPAIVTRKFTSEFSSWKPFHYQEALKQKEQPSLPFQRRTEKIEPLLMKPLQVPYGITNPTLTMLNFRIAINGAEFLWGNSRSLRGRGVMIYGPQKILNFARSSDMCLCYDCLIRGIVADRISQVVSKILQWTLSGHNGLNKEAEHREHGQSTIFYLLYLKLSKCLRIVGKAQRVEASTGVKRVDHLAKWSTGNTVALNSTHQDNLSSPNGQDALGMDQARVAQVVKSTLAKDLSSSLEPHSLTELDTVASQQLWEDAPEGSKHGPSAVDHLKLTILGEGFWVSRKPSGVPTVVTWKFTSEVRWGLTGEWAQVLDSLGTVPRAAG
ncbi:hypothetical protein RJ640_030035 [Escallonia rubra]|uniref:Uncharacterized protein n=1 Tax=Escallonia rubra TaxID=112253 RepID=A0AA88S2M1_9ASTE|nr:hypothetical protein RJ640_030035 [Escallonia rubra]